MPTKKTSFPVALRDRDYTNGYSEAESTTASAHRPVSIRKGAELLNMPKSTYYDQQKRMRENHMQNGNTPHPLLNSLRFLNLQALSGSSLESALIENVKVTLDGLCDIQVKGEGLNRRTGLLLYVLSEQPAFKPLRTLQQFAEQKWKKQRTWVMRQVRFGRLTSQFLGDEHHLKVLTSENAVRCICEIEAIEDQVALVKLCSEMLADSKMSSRIAHGALLKFVNGNRSTPEETRNSDERLALLQSLLTKTDATVKACSSLVAEIKRVTSECALGTNGLHVEKVTKQG